LKAHSIRKDTDHSLARSARGCRRAALRCGGPFPETHSFSCFHIRNFLTPIIESRCAHLQESDRTLRDGSFGLAMSQALRARLRSHRPSGTKPFAHRGPRIKLALLGPQELRSTPNKLSSLGPAGGACSPKRRNFSQGIFVPSLLGFNPKVSPWCLLGLGERNLFPVLKIRVSKPRIPPTPFPSYHQIFQGPQYGPKSSYIDDSSLICAASI
jgi:hypothetical protein